MVNDVGGLCVLRIIEEDIGLDVSGVGCKFLCVAGGLFVTR